jgi:hypothetical protein
LWAANPERSGFGTPPHSNQRRSSRPRNLPIPHAISSAVWPVFPGFFDL